MQGEFNSEIYGLLPAGIPEIESLAALALDMRWSWNHEADDLWQQLDPVLWEFTHNPWIVLQTVSKDQLKTQIADPVFKNRISELIQLKESYLSYLTFIIPSSTRKVLAGSSPTS